MSQNQDFSAPCGAISFLREVDSDPWGLDISLSAFQLEGMPCFAPEPLGDGGCDTACAAGGTHSPGTVLWPSATRSASCVLWDAVYDMLRSWGRFGVESGAGAPAVGSGGSSGAFATGLSPAPLATFPVPRSPNPACRFPAPGSPVGSCTSHTGDEFQQQQGSWPHGFGREELHGSRLDCGCGLACQQACRRLDGPRPRTPEKPPPPGTRPSLPHVMRPGFSGILRGNRPSHSRYLSPFNILPHLGSLSSTGITRRRQ